MPILRPTLAIIRFGPDEILNNDTGSLGEDAFLAQAAQRIPVNAFGASPLDPTYDSTFIQGDLGTVSISGDEITLSAGVWHLHSFGLFSCFSLTEDFIMRARYTNSLDDGANVEVFQTSPETLIQNATPAFQTEGDNSHPSHNYLLLADEPHILTYRAGNLTAVAGIIGGLRLGILTATFVGP